MPDEVVLVAWNQVPDPTALAAALAGELLGRHPGPLHHSCPTCGSIEHGRPYFDAPVEVSIAHAPPVTLVAVSAGSRIGVDLERHGVADRSWVESEAAAKAAGTGIVGPPAQPPNPTLTFVDLSVPGHLAVLAAVSCTAPEIRERTGAEGAKASPTRR